MTGKDDIENFISESFENFSVTPSETVKKRIDKTMFFQNMVHFHLAKLIIGTALFTTITGVVLYFSLFNSHESNLQISNISNSNKIEINSTTANNNDIIIQENISNENNLTNSEDNKAQTVSSITTYSNDHLAISKENKTVNFAEENSSNSEIISSTAENKMDKANDIKYKATPTENNISKKNQTIKNEIFENIKPKVESKSPDLITENKKTENEKVIDYNIITNIPAQAETNSNNSNQNLLTYENADINNNSNIDLAKENVKNENLTDRNNSKNIIANKNLQTNISGNDLGFEIIYNKMSSLPFQKMENKTEEYKMNLLAIDSNLLKEYLKAQNRWFLDLYWMTSSSTSFYKTDNSEYDNFIEQKNNAVQTSFSFNSFGLHTGFYRNNIQFKTGFGYTNITDKYKFTLILNNPTEKTNLIFNNNPYDFEQNGTYYNIDTIGGYYHYTFMQDSIIHLFDSSWVDITDSNIVNMYDSVQFVQYDSLKNKEYLNNYSYFEIPLSIGYRFQYNNFEITPEAGIIAGYLYKKEGINISNDLNNNETYIKTFPYKKFIISGSLALNINYNITENLGIFIEPSYRQTIASFFNSSSIIKGNSKSFMLKFGIRKKL